MISESVIIFGASGNVVMIVNGELPRDQSINFKVSDSALELIGDNNTLIYAEHGLNDYTCRRLRLKGEIGLLEVRDPAHPPKHLTNIAYQMAG